MDLEAFTVIDRGRGRKNWFRIGTGYYGKGDSITIILDALPIDKRLVIIKKGGINLIIMIRTIDLLPFRECTDSVQIDLVVGPA